MIAALNNTTTSNGPGATTGQSARLRDADVNDASTDSSAEASAVVSLSPQAANLAAAPRAAQEPAPAASAPASAASPAPALAPAPAASAPVPAPAPTVTAQSTSFQPANALAANVGQSTVEKFPPPVSLIPNLVYAEADRDENGVVSPAERRAYDVVHPKLGERPADVPPKRVVDAELREYNAIASKQF
jgi:hypothetical protein